MRHREPSESSNTWSLFALASHSLHIISITKPATRAQALKDIFKDPAVVAPIGTIAE